MRAITIPFLHVDAFVHVQLDQLAGNLEGDVHLRQFEVAGNAQAVGVRRCRRPVDVDSPRPRGDGDEENNRENESFFIMVPHWIMLWMVPVAVPRSMRARL